MRWMPSVHVTRLRSVADSVTRKEAAGGRTPSPRAQTAHLFSGAVSQLACSTLSGKAHCHVRGPNAWDPSAWNGIQVHRIQAHRIQTHRIQTHRIQAHRIQVGGMQLYGIQVHETQVHRIQVHRIYTQGIRVHGVQVHGVQVGRVVIQIDQVSDPGRTL
jgi:hypothetical protein